VYRFFFFSSRRRHTRLQGDWSSDVCSSDLLVAIKELLKRVDVETLSVELREKMRHETSLQKKLKHTKRLKVVEAFRKSGNKPQRSEERRVGKECRSGGVKAEIKEHNRNTGG